MRHSAHGNGYAEPQIVNSIEGTFPQIRDGFRKIAAERIRYITGTTDWVSDDDVKWDDFVYGNRLALISIPGKDLRCTIKCHFQLEEFVTAPDQADALKTFDLLREFLNLCAGGLKIIFQTSELTTGISLPIVTSGYDEIVFSESYRGARLFDYFRLTSGKKSLVVTLVIEPGSERVVEQLRKFVNADVPSSDDVEFL